MLFTFVLCITFCETVGKNHVVVATYNLWNVMYQWEIRKLYIAEMIQKTEADIIGFQDVRAIFDLTHSQIDELQFLLPEYKYKQYLPLQLVKDRKNFQTDGWEWEGVGFLSKFRILNNVAFNHSLPLGSPDQTNRAFLYAQFHIEPDDMEINVIFVDLSHHKLTQCSNAYEIVKFIYSVGVESLIVMGNFNVDEEFNIPLKAIADGYFSDSGGFCKDIGNVFNQEQYLSHDYKFHDAWVNMNWHFSGFTFSNLPSTGLESRPDRILVSQTGMKISSSLTLGKGPLYEHRYGTSLSWNRFHIVLKAAKQRNFGEQQNSTCVAACGPRTSCRCGLCIKGENQSCAPGECPECAPSKLFVFHLVFIVFSLCSVYLIGCVVVLLVIAARPQCRRLLMNKLRVGKVARFSYFFFALFVYIFLIIYAKIQFEDVIRLVNLQPMDELNPSNHLMMVARVELI